MLASMTATLSERILGKDIRFIISSCCLWLGWSLVSAQPQRLDFERIGTEQGLSHLTVTAIFQDSQGYVWFGTIDGLNRFDGYQAKVYRHDPDVPTSISSSFIHGMLEDGHGNLWIGTRDGGLSVLTVENRETGIFKRYVPEQDDRLSLGHERVESFYLDRAKRLWVGTQAGLARYDETNDGFVIYDFFQSLEEPVLVSSMLEDENQNLWMSTSQGLFKLDLSQIDDADPRNCDALMTRYAYDPENPEGLSAAWIYKLFLDRDGYLWLGTRTGGISRFDRATGKSVHYRHDPQDPFSLTKNYAAVHFQDEQGLLWVSTDGGGINLLNPETGRFYAYQHQPARSQSLSHNQVTRIFRSNDGVKGTLWVGTWGGGVNKLLSADKPFAVWRHDPENPHSLNGSFILSVLEEASGTQWVGTSMGLNRLKPGSKQWDRMAQVKASKDFQGNHVIWSMAQSHRGDLWLGTEEAGLQQVQLSEHADAPRVVTYKHDPSDPQSIRENGVKVVFEDRDGFLWLGYEEQGLSRGKLVQGQAPRWQHVQAHPDIETGLGSPRVRCIYQDKAGIIWVGTLDAGFYRLDQLHANGKAVFTGFKPDVQDPLKLNHGDIRAIFEGEDGGLWLATFGGGLNRLDREQGVFTQVTTRDGLANNFVYGLLEDGLGHLWVSTNRGISQYAYATGRIVNYGTQHGLQSDEYNTGAYFAGPSGTLYFGGVLGLNHFKPAALFERLERERQYVPPVVLTSFSNMGEALPLPELGDQQSAVVLEHDDKYFSFEMAALDYRNPAKNRFRYKLEGFHDAWIDHGNRRFGSFTNLDPGNYTLRYQGSTHPGVWHDGEPLEILIKKPFWQTWWFRALMLIALVLAVLLAMKVRTYRRAYRRMKYVAHFKIMRTLGQGGAGTVYLAKDLISKKPIALKVLHSELEDAHDGVRRFLQEAEIGGKLNHPNIVRIIEAGSQGKLRYLCMEYLEGQTLKELIQAQGPLPEEVAIKLSKHMLSGLQAIHEHGVVHRDLKSANLMVLEGQHIKIMDFGVARMSGLTTVENRDQLMGTLAYMSPEQTLGKGVDLRADIYAFGSILHEMLFGVVPFQAENEMEMIFAIHNEPPRGLPNSKAALTPLEAIMEKCLAKDPEDRFSSVAELLTVLEKAAEASGAREIKAQTSA